MAQYERPDDIEVDFEVVTENWNDYLLTDGNRIKARIILTRVFKAGLPNEFLFEFAAPIFTVIASPSGEKNNEPKQEEWNNLPTQDIELKSPANEKWNEYKIADSNKTIQIKYSVSKIRKAIDRYDKNGRPFYIISGAPAITVN